MCKRSPPALTTSRLTMGPSLTFSAPGATSGHQPGPSAPLTHICLSSRTHPAQDTRGQGPHRQRQRVREEDQHGDWEDLHHAGQQLLCWRRGGTRRVSGEREPSQSFLIISNWITVQSDPVRTFIYRKLDCPIGTNSVQSVLFQIEMKCKTFFQLNTDLLLM